MKNRSLLSEAPHQQIVKHNMLIVGLTGGIATGKSTVSTTLKDKYNISVIDADVIAKEVVNPGRKAYQRIIETFGDEVPDLVSESDGSLNRPALGKAVFGNKVNLSKLNSIVHPAVRKEIFWQLFKAYISFNDIVILDVPLLFEATMHRLCGLVITVSCERIKQIERLKLRNPELSEDDANKRIDSQMSNEERNYRADLVIDNSKTEKDLQDSIDSIVHEIRPGMLYTLLDYFPPFGLVSALYTFATRSFRDKYKGTKPHKKLD